MLLTRLLVVLALLCATAFGQANANKGQITGTVYDTAGAAVAGAAVTIRNAETGLNREMKTDEGGAYRGVALDPGTYEITAVSSGFAPTTLAGLVLNVGASVTADITLKVEATTTTVEVGETLIDLQIPAQTTTTTTTQIQNLPILGRRFQDFATLSPTVQVDPQRGQLSFAGQRGINSNVMLDGSDYNQPFFGGIRGGERSNFIPTVPQAAIQEFQVVTTGYTAEYGRSSGGILNTVTKSGTNDVHGEAFYQIRHRELGLDNPILGIPSSETLQQFGGGIGGSLIKDKFFWFGAYEQQKSEAPRRVFFSTLQGVNPTPETAEAPSFYRSQEQPFTQTNNALTGTLRGDYQFASGNRLTLRFNTSRGDAEYAGSVGGALSPLSNSALSNEAIERDRTYSGTTQYTHLFSPTILNDTRFTVTTEIRPREAVSELPTVSNSGIGTFGARSFLPTTQDDTRYQLTNSLSVAKGRNNLKFGVDWSRISAFQEFGFNQFGSFNFGTTNVNRILTLLSGPNRFAGTGTEINYQRQIGNLLAKLGSYQLAFYAQDSFRVNNKLTLDFGLRYEGQWSPNPDTSNTALVQSVQNAAFPAGRLDPTKIRDTLNQVMPRFGFAWTPFTSGRRTVVRGHTGLFYAATPLLVFADSINQFRTTPGNLSIRVDPTSTLNLRQVFAQAGYDLGQGSLNALPIIPLDVVQRAAGISAGTTSVNPFNNASVSVMDPNFRNPRAFQAGLGIESELFSNFTAGLQLTYVNTVGLMRNRDYNLPLPTLRPVANSPDRPVFTRAQRPAPTLGTVTVRETSARSMYRGASFSAQYRVRRYQFQAFYTLSETFSDSDEERDSGGFSYDNPFNFSRDYNYSRLDARHNFVGNFVTFLPWGFELAGIYRARSGYPLNPTAGSDLNTDTSNTDRPYIANGVPMRRDEFRNRPFYNFDLRAMKSFYLFGNERRKLQLSAEFFNLFNFDNVAYAFSNSTLNGIYGPGPYPTATDANGIRFQRLRLPNGSYDPSNLQVGNPLQIQLGLRFFF
ncbi:MAG TPA: carboxypeptidase regulatory-like domain-containing protein [Bryobacteraceae bacterium]|nr:carboxypeptidase regulatory-like domain-containing protein [Bryobacteraceae bacterium]